MRKNYGKKTVSTLIHLGYRSSSSIPQKITADWRNYVPASLQVLFTQKNINKFVTFAVLIGFATHQLYAFFQKKQQPVSAELLEATFTKTVKTLNNMYNNLPLEVRPSVSSSSYSTFGIISTISTDITPLNFAILMLAKVKVQINDETLKQTINSMQTLTECFRASRNNPQLRTILHDVLSQESQRITNIDQSHFASQAVLKPAILKNLETLSNLSRTSDPT